MNLLGEHNVAPTDSLPPLVMITSNKALSAAYCLPDSDLNASVIAEVYLPRCC